LEAYSRPKKGGIRAILLEEGDEVVGVALSSPGDTIVISARGGRAIHFDEAGARAMGRTSRGVRGIRLKDDDVVVGMIVVEEGAELLTACENGYGKRTSLTDYPLKGRGGQGVISIRISDRNGPVVAVSKCMPGDDVMFITSGGMIVRTPISEISSMGRSTQGVRLVNLKADDKLVSMEVISERDLERYSRDREGAEGEERHLGKIIDVPAAEAPNEPPDDAAGDESGDDGEDDTSGGE
ncbi:MAG: DNA gyrase subunit A, partial [Planctomycetota bacterium]